MLGEGMRGNRREVDGVKVLYQQSVRRLDYLPPSIYDHHGSVVFWASLSRGAMGFKGHC